jgi:hypothetical protein
MKSILTLALCLLFTSAVNATLITDVDNINSRDGNDVYQLSTLLEEVNAFIDRNHQYENIPAFLLGADFVQVANDDKKAGGGFQILFTLSAEATVYLFLDNRMNVASAMPWVVSLGFVDTGNDIGVDEGANGNVNRYSSVYAAVFSAGQYTFFEQNDGNSRNMYAIAAVAAQVPAPGTLVLFAASILGLIIRRRIKR